MIMEVVLLSLLLLLSINLRRVSEMHSAIATDLNFDMSSITPLFAPGVTDDPVFGATVPVETPADKSH